WPFRNFARILQGRILKILSVCLYVIYRSVNYFFASSKSMGTPVAIREWRGMETIRTGAGDFRGHEEFYRNGACDAKYGACQPKKNDV
ncbi:MAG: hypothetical protein O7G87_15745, partial [bacterium]|nr:hypothetical protein [bacterium]